MSRTSPGSELYMPANTLFTEGWAVIGMRLPPLGGPYAPWLLWVCASSRDWRSEPEAVGLRLVGGLEDLVISSLPNHRRHRRALPEPGSRRKPLPCPL